MDSSYCCYSSFSAHYFGSNHENTPCDPKTTVSIPIDDGTLTIRDAAAARIQAAYRGRLVRRLVGAVRDSYDETGSLERLIQRQDTVDAVRRDARERVRLNELLMAALLRLDAVPGFYPAVRDLRRTVSHRLVALQEVLDAVAAAPAGDEAAAAFPPSLEELVSRLAGDRTAVEEEEVKGSDSSGFECLERFLWGCEERF